MVKKKGLIIVGSIVLCGCLAGGGVLLYNNDQSGAIYEQENLSSVNKKVNEYIISPDAKKVLASCSASQMKAGVYALSENSTLDSYNTLPDEVLEIETAAKWMAKNCKSLMNVAIESVPEQNTWIAGTYLEKFESRDKNAGIISYSYLNTKEEGVIEFTGLGVDDGFSKASVNMYIKLTETDVENEPIVEYYSGGSYMFYVPNKEIYVQIGTTVNDENGGYSRFNEYFCTSYNGKFTARITEQKTFEGESDRDVIISGNTQNGFHKVIYNDNRINEESGEVVVGTDGGYNNVEYAYYKNNKKIISLNPDEFLIDLSMAENLDIDFNESQMNKTQVSASGQNTTGDEMGDKLGNKYKINQTINSINIDDVVVEENTEFWANGNEVASKVKFVCKQSDAPDSALTISGVDSRYQIFENQYLKIDNPFQEYYNSGYNDLQKVFLLDYFINEVNSEVEPEVWEGSTFTSVSHIKNDYDATNSINYQIFGETNYVTLLDVYNDYFNLESDILKDEAEAAKNAITQTELSFNCEDFIKKIGDLDVKYSLRSLSSGSLEENYPKSFYGVDFDARAIYNECKMFNHDLKDENPNPTFKYESTTTAYSNLEYYKNYFVKFILVKDNKQIDLKTSENSTKLIDPTKGNNGQVVIGDGKTYAKTSFSLQDILSALTDEEGNLSTGRYDLYSCYLLDGEMLENSLTSVSAFRGVAKGQYYNYTYHDEENDLYYNIELNNLNSDKLTFDSNFYVNITPIAMWFCVCKESFL